MTDSKKPKGKLRNSGIVQKETEELQALIKEVERDTAVHLLVILGSVLEDVKKQYRIPEDAVRDIYHIMKEEAIRKGWVD